MKNLDSEEVEREFLPVMVVHLEQHMIDEVVLRMAQLFGNMVFHLQMHCFEDKHAE
jgi:hypothetical protein